MFNHKEQQGFLTLAYSSNKVDYLELAYLQAMSIKTTMPNAKTAVVVDFKTKKNVTSKIEKVFDYIIEGKDSEWPM